MVGVADRGPVEPSPLGNVAELIDQFGPASRYTMPEIRTAFANGVARVWVARIAPGRGRKAEVDDQRPRRRAGGHVRRPRRGQVGRRTRHPGHPGRLAQPAGVKYVDLEVLLGDEVVERIDNLVADPDSPNDLFTKVNAQSRLIVAVDPVFAVDLPGTIARTALADADARPATATLRSGATDAILVQAKRPGAAGNLLSVQLAAAPASRTLESADGPSVVVSTRTARPDGTNFSVTVQPAGPDSVSLTINPPGGGALRTYGPADSVDALVTAAAADPDVLVTPAGARLPAPVDQQRLQRRVDVVVFTEGREPRVHAGIGSVEDLVAISDAAVSFSAIGNAPPMPPADAGTALIGGGQLGGVADQAEGHRRVVDRDQLIVVADAGVHARLAALGEHDDVDPALQVDLVDRRGELGAGAGDEHVGIGGRRRHQCVDRARRTVGAQGGAARRVDGEVDGVGAARLHGDRELGAVGADGPRAHHDARPVGTGERAARWRRDELHREQVAGGAGPLGGHGDQRRCLPRRSVAVAAAASASASAVWAIVPGRSVPKTGSTATTRRDWPLTLVKRSLGLSGSATTFSMRSTTSSPRRTSRSTYLRPDD